MERIAVVGCGGSGKSRLARELGALLGIAPVHLDGLYYDQDWQPLDKERFAAAQHELVSAPRWIIDGNYATSLPIRLQAADTVIFLDLPAVSCLRGILQRRLRYRGRQLAAIGVYDRITWEFIRYILGYRKRMSPRVWRLIAVHADGAQVVVLRSRRAVRRFLASAVAVLVCARSQTTTMRVGSHSWQYAPSRHVGDEEVQHEGGVRHRCGPVA